MTPQRGHSGEPSGITPRRQFRQKKGRSRPSASKEDSGLPELSRPGEWTASRHSRQRGGNTESRSALSAATTVCRNLASRLLSALIGETVRVAPEMPTALTGDLEKRNAGRHRGVQGIEWAHLRY